MEQTYTQEQLLQVLRNVGWDVECGACMSLAMTGIMLPYDSHTCTSSNHEGEPETSDETKERREQARAEERRLSRYDR